MAEEIEIKLALPESSRRALLRHPLLRAAERLPTRKLASIYYDTPALDLHRRGIALRARRQAGRWLQTVKCAGLAGGGLSQRPEWEQPFSGRFDFSAVDDAEARELLERARDEARLETVFETLFTRRSWRLRPKSGGAVLLMLDQGWIAASGRREALGEIEIELELGAPACLFDVARALAAELPLQPEQRSKAERGYRLRENAPLVPVKAARSPVRPEQAPLEAFAATVADCLAQFQANAAGIGKADAEFVHQMRVALRRLRSALRLFRPLLPDGLEAAVAPPLRELAACLGQARDWDVLAEDILAPAARAFPGEPRLAALAAAVERRRLAARADLPAASQARPFILAQLDIAACAFRRSVVADAPALPKFAARRLARLRRKAMALAQAAQDMDAQRLHGLRIGVKRLRYAAEFLAPLLRRRDLRRTLEVLNDLQDSLGGLNDLARAGPLLAQCLDDDPQLREAVALAGGWHGPRYAALQDQARRGMRRLLRLPPLRAG